MPAVRKVNVRLVIGREPERFRERRLDRKVGTLSPICLLTLSPRIADPPTQPDVEQRHQESHRRRGVIAHVGAGRRARDRYGRAKRNASIAVPIFPTRAIGLARGSGVERTYREGLCLPLLPGEIFGGDDVEGHVDDMKWLPSAGAICGPELVHGAIIRLVEVGERIGISMRIGRAEEGANDPIAIERMQRKTIDVDEYRREGPDDRHSNEPYEQSRGCAGPWRDGLLRNGT